MIMQMKIKIFGLVIVFVVAAVMIKIFTVRQVGFLKHNRYVDIPRDSIESVKLRQSDFRITLEKEIEHSAEIFVEFWSIIKKHNTRIIEGVAATAVYSDKLTMTTDENIYEIRFVQELSGKGLAEYSIENGSPLFGLIYLDRTGATKIRVLLDRAFEEGAGDKAESHNQIE